MGSASPAEPKNEWEGKAAGLIMKDMARSTYDSIVTSALSEYRFIQQSGRDLRRLGKAARECRKDRRHRFTSYSAFFAIDIDENGIAHTHRNAFGEAVDEENLSKVRECEMCGRLFWAGRDDKECCSVPCQNKRRKKRWKQEYDKGKYQ